MIPYDKKLHFIAGLVIALLVGIILSPIEGIGVAIAAGMFKECYDDYRQDGAFDKLDMIATWLGGCVGFTVLSLINYWRS